MKSVLKKKSKISKMRDLSNVNLNMDNINIIIPVMTTTYLLLGPDLISRANKSD